MTTEDNQRVSQALEGWVQGLPNQTPGQGSGILGDWIAVVSMVAVSPEGHPVTEYYLCMKDGTMLPHIAKGLLYEGVDQVDAQREGGE